MINGHTGPITRMGWQRWNRQVQELSPRIKKKISFTATTPLKPQAQAESQKRKIKLTFQEYNSTTKKMLHTINSRIYRINRKLIMNAFQSHQIKWPTTGFKKAKNKLDSHARNKSQQFLKLQSRIRIWIGSGVKSWKSQQANFWRKIIDRQLIQE